MSALYKYYMDAQANLAKIKEQIEKAKSIVIATGGPSNADSLGSALSLYLGLIGIGKTVSVVSPEPAIVEFSNFVGVNKLETKISGKRNFIISLDYQEGSIEKVSYNIEGNKFNLVIEPRQGFEEFSADKVHYTTSGGTADLIITVGTGKVEDLGALYEENKEFFTETPVINIDCRKENTGYGTVNYIDTAASSTTEVVAVVMSYIGVKLTEDIATNILNAIEQSTDRFQSVRVNARTFEIASVCMKAGGKRFAVNLMSQAPSVNVPLQEKPQNEPSKPSQTKTQETQSEDWLKPKIFKNPNPNG